MKPYLFKVYPYSNNTLKNSNTKDSFKILTAVSQIDTAQLLSYDEQSLSNFAAENELKLKFLSDSITLEKFIPVGKDSQRFRDHISEELSKQYIDIKE